MCGIDYCTKIILIRLYVVQLTLQKGPGVKSAKMILITNSCLVRTIQVFASSAAPLLQFGFLFSWRRRAGASEICVKSFGDVTHERWVFTQIAAHEFMKASTSKCLWDAALL